MQFVLSTPALYALELTPRCNNHCPGCFNVFADDRAGAQRTACPPLTAAQWRTILTKIQPHVERVKLTGGEPTLHPEFYDIVHALADLRISFSIFTNARWSQPERLVECLKSTPQCVGLLVSLHGADAETHEAYTEMPGSFEETVRNIRRAVGAGMNIATSTVITEQNYDRLKEVVALSARLGTDHAVINRYLGVPLPGIEPDEQELRTAVQTVEQLRQAGARVKFGSCIPQCFTQNSSTGCLAGVAFCAISPWGDLRPCNHSPTIAGNLLQQSAQEAWHSTTMAAWRALMPQDCETRCALFSACHGGCRALIEERTRQCDPLRHSPITVTPRHHTQITFYEGLRPLGKYRARQEAFGWVLMRGNRILPITCGDYAIAQRCDGSHTLRELENDFGKRGLQTITLLHQRGLLEFANEHSPLPVEAKT